MESTLEKMALFSKFEDISHETDIMLKEVNDTLCELRKMTDDRSTIVSSKRSSRSSKSKSSHITNVSSTLTARQRRLNLEEELATLQAKLNGHDSTEREIK